MKQYSFLQEGSIFSSPATKTIIQQELIADINDFSDKIPDGAFTVAFLFHRHGSLVIQPEYRSLVPVSFMQKLYSTISKYVDAYEAFVMIHNKRLVAFKYELFDPETNQKRIY